MWVSGQKPASEPGIIISVMVADARATCESITAAGGEIVRPVDPTASEIVAWFRDPAGNVMGIYEHRGLR
jgi:uncharacterized protein